MSDKVYIGPNKVGHFEKGAAYPPLSRVTMWYDDEHFFTAGDDTGYIMTVDNPWATQEIVNDVYNKLKGFVYQPFEATGVSWDPSIELGDAVNIGGIYSMIGRREVRMGKEYIANISCPGEKEIDHDFPHYSKTERELKRRVKLGNKYQGVKIDRQNGLTITETDGETEGAKVVLNSKEFSFYDAGGGRVLYFDPTSGTYKFLGELNVNDKFVVDKSGNVKLAGNINMGEGTITWGKNTPNKKRYAASTSGPWHDTMQSGDIYCCDWDYSKNSEIVEENWGAPYKFKGVDGQPGAPATLPGYIKKTHIDATGIETFHIKANKIEAVCPAGSADDTETGFILTSGFDDQTLRYLRIYSYEGMEPVTVFTSPNSCHATFDFGGIELRTGILNLRNISSIDWGKNAPKAVFE